MKQKDPLVNFEVIKNPATGEYMLDFLVSHQNEKGVAEIVEWNIYRYKQLTGKAGKAGVLLFAYCCRSYGNNINQFLTSLKSNRKAFITKMSTYDIPTINIK